MRGSTAGITDGLRGSSRLHYIFLTILDNVLSSLIISPLVVSYWRGTWSLMDRYVYSGRPRESGAVSLAIGLVGVLVFTVTQRLHGRILHPESHRLVYYVLSRFYTALFGFVCVNSWRGAWMALDTYTGGDAPSVAVTTLVSLLLLLASRTLRNISAPPFAIVTDRYDGYFDVPTMFKASSDDLWMYILDCGFSVCVIGTLVVFVWRGVWCLLDMYLYPGDMATSAWASLAIGYSLVLVSFGAQPLIKWVVIRAQGLCRLAAVDLYLVFSFCGTINVWRGFWNLLNVYFISDRPTLSYWLSHLLAFMVLVLINSSNSVLVRGVYIDAEEEGEQCVDFPCYYLRLFFQVSQFGIIKD
ncbi:hypothetical protein AAG570_003710 [Ranatra chinensis]|uniref:Fuseless n=1 Tax=Ranatra chinensis TaxID=642074 RepID=A0ABD0Y4I1_9HEMI